MTLTCGHHLLLLFKKICILFVAGDYPFINNGGTDWQTFHTGLVPTQTCSLSFIVKDGNGYENKVFPCDLLGVIPLNVCTAHVYLKQPQQQLISRERSKCFYQQ